MSRILKTVLAVMLVLTAAMGLKTVVQAHSSGTMVADGGDPLPAPW